MIVWLMFAILGVSLFGGKFFYCSIDKYRFHNEYECVKEGGVWEKYYNNFDDVIQAMTTLFIVSSFDNWPEIMNKAVDSTKIDYVINIF